MFMAATMSGAATPPGPTPTGLFYEQLPLARQSECVCVQDLERSLSPSLRSMAGSFVGPAPGCSGEGEWEGGHCLRRKPHGGLAQCRGPHPERCLCVAVKAPHVSSPGAQASVLLLVYRRKQALLFQAPVPGSGGPVIFQH